MKTGLLKKILADDGGDVLVVSHVLSEHHEGHRDVGSGDGADVGAVDLLVAAQRIQEGEQSEIGSPRGACGMITSMIECRKPGGVPCLM